MDELFDPERRQLAEEYHRTKDTHIWYGRLILFIFWVCFFLFAWEIRINNLLLARIENRELIILGYVFIFYFLYSVLNIVIDYFFFYRLDREYELSSQEPGEWFLDCVKGFLLGFVVLYAGGRLFLYTVSRWPDHWWLPFSLIAAVFVLLLTYLFPKIILPLFFNTEEYPDGSLKDRLMKLIERTGLEVEEIYEINLSSKMTYGNAAVVGLGKTRKILLGDNLVEEHSEDEIETILAHELGHHARGDIWRHMLLQPLNIMLVSYLVSVLKDPLMLVRGYYTPDAVYILPLIFLLWKFFSWLLSPIIVWYNRRREHEADRYALKKARKPAAFASALAGLADAGLAKLEYSLYEMLFEASHPPIAVRVKHALDWDEEE